MELDKYFNWEAMALSTIIGIMVKALEIEEVTYTCEARANVETGVWHCVRVNHNGKQWSVDSQRAELLKARLIKALDKRGHRQLYKSIKAGNGEPNNE